MTERVLQLTDLHLFADADGQLNGVPTRACLRDVLDHIAADPQAFDHVIISGDLAQDEQLETYRVIHEMINQLETPFDVLPGNHDHRGFMFQTFANIDTTVEKRITFARTVGAWRLVGLDSRIPGDVPGRLGNGQLDWLSETLAAHPRPTLLFVHHPPFPVGSEWIDRIGLEDAEELMDVVAKCPWVRGISAGHVHQTFDARRGDVRLMTSPSTAFQFEPDSPSPAYQPIPPGYRVFEFDGESFRSEVIRLPELKYSPARLRD